MSARVETLYLSGPMTNKPGFNFPVFDDAARYVKTIGAPDVSYDVISPAEHDRDVIRQKFMRGDIHFARPDDVPGYESGDVKQYNAATATNTGTDLLAWDFQAIINDADGIVMLPGWELSTGARAERLVAEQTGKHVYLLTRNHVDWFDVLIDGDHEWCFGSDIKQTRVSDALREWGETCLQIDGCDHPDCEDCAISIPASQETIGGIKVVRDARVPLGMAYLIQHYGDISDQAFLDHLTGTKPLVTAEQVAEIIDREYTEGIKQHVAHVSPLMQAALDAERDATAAMQPVDGSGEWRVVDAKSGGAKGSKLARFDLVPPDALWAVAEHFGRGARKYADRNWELGFNWSLAIAALERHLALYKQGIDFDDDPALYASDAEDRSRHITAVAWQAIVLLAFSLRDIGTDDRAHLHGTSPGGWSSADER